MKTIKIRQALLLTLTLFTALQAVTTFGMENGNEGSWLSNTIFSTISKCYNTDITQIKKHPYMTAGAAVFLTVAVTGLAALYQKKQNGAQLKKQQEPEKNELQKPKEEEKEKNGIKEQQEEEKKIEQQKLEEEEEEKAIKLLEQQEQENNKKKNEKIEKEETTKDFKYTASMAHLMTVLDGKVTLTPKPQNEKDQKNWLWSDGVLSENGTTYSVTYKNKTYVSTKKENSWEATEENQMDYFVYYDYLVDNKKWVMRKKVEEKENFMKYLINLAIEQFAGVLYYPKQELKVHYLKIFAEAFTREEEHKDKYVFYNGYIGELEFWFDFVDAVNKYNQFKDNNEGKMRLERSKEEGLEIYKDANSFLAKNPIKNGDDEAKSNPYLLAANISLFFNANEFGECTLNYLSRNRSQLKNKKISPYDLVKSFANKIGINEASLNIQGFEKLFESYQKLNGTLRQILVPRKYVDQICYFSKCYGVPFTIEEIKEIFGNKININNQAPFITISRAIDFLRSSPCKNFANYIDNPQARVMHFHEAFFDKEYAKKSGIETFQYYTSKEEMERENLRNNMQIKVKNILSLTTL